MFPIPSLSDISAYMARHPNTKLQRVAGMKYYITLQDGASLIQYDEYPLTIGPDIWLATRRK